MTTLSIPLSQPLEDFVRAQVKKGYAPNKAEVVRKALRLLAEEEAIATVLKAEREVSEGKILRGDLRKLTKRIL